MTAMGRKRTVARMRNGLFSVASPRWIAPYAGDLVLKIAA